MSRDHGRTSNGYDFKRASDAIKNNQVQWVSFGKLLLANPDLAECFAKGAPLNAPDQATFYGGDAVGYTDYPFMA